MPKDDNRPFVVSRLHAKWALDAKRLVFRNKNPGHAYYMEGDFPSKEGFVGNWFVGPGREFTEEKLLAHVGDPDWEFFVYDKPFENW